jgi:DNA-binding response OmpR family regulator
MVKPFAFTELLARLSAIHRRTANQSRLLRVGRLVVDEGRRVCALTSGEEVELSARQFTLLALLARDGGRVVTRAMVLSEVLGYSLTPSANIVDVHVSNLRQKLARVDSGVAIVTVRGVGYRLEEVV